MDGPGEESRRGGNLHVTKAPDLAQPFSVPAGWNSPFKLKDDFHVFGLEWGPEYIRWYLEPFGPAITRLLEAERSPGK